MKQSNWTDERLECILKQLPAVKDKRNPSFIYQQIRAKQNVRRKKHWLFPSIATVCSLFLFWIIATSFLDSGISSSDKKSTLKENNSMVALQTDKKMDKANVLKEEKRTLDSVVGNLEAISIYPEDVNGNEVLTYPIPDKNLQVVVPVSILVDKNQAASKFDLYKEYMKKLTEESWGLKDYYPIKADLSFDAIKKEVAVNVTKTPVVFKANGDNLYSAILNEQLHEVGAKKINFYTNNKQGIVFGDYGEIRSEKYKRLEKRGYFLLNAGKETNRPYYVPSLDSYNSIEKAFNDMHKDNKTLGLSASLPSTIHFEKISSNQSNKQLVISLTKDSKLEENHRTIRAIESILLTAKDFHYSSVKFENTKLTQLGRFTLTKEVRVPIAANKKEIH
ncbi:hypothetical protein [Niallia sp. 03133]|uniref:hypothetical protein n=1 Tax=Niallia sp. 03133 TaxID=3458060 RepID=UPI004044EE08